MDKDEETALSSGSAAQPPRPDVATMMACGSCGRIIQTGDAFCRFCGKALTRKKKVAWYYEPVWILILGFVVVGPLVLPLVILSPKLGRTAKWGISLALVAYAVVLVYLGYETILLTWNAYAQLSDQLKGIR
jgi:hypothetical protein